MKAIESSKKLILNCDDLGPNPRVIQGLLLTKPDRLIKSGSVITNFPSSLNQLFKFHQDFPNFSLGVHLNYTSGKPITSPHKISSLVDKNGTFLNIQSTQNHIRRDHLKIEFLAQIKALVKLGITPSHLDNHHPNIYLEPKLFEVVLEIAKENRLPIRMPFTQNFFKNIDFYAKVLKKPKERLLSTANAILDLCDSYSTVYPDYFYGEFTFGDQTENTFIHILQNLKKGFSEICLHIIKGGTESQILQNPRITSVIKEMSIQLISYQDLKIAD